jgi:hypothetical protein
MMMFRNNNNHANHYGEEVYEEEYGQEDEDAVVDRIFDQTDEKQDSIYSLNSHSEAVNQQHNTTTSINLGPNLNMQVNAIGRVRRRKRGQQNEDEQDNVVQPPLLIRGESYGQNAIDMEEHPKYKVLNNRNIMPLKHSRYTNDD